MGTHRFPRRGTPTKELRELSAAEGGTLFTTLLAAFQVFLFRYSGQNDILVGSPTTGRSRPEFAAIVGNFVNMVVLRARPEEGWSFRHFLREGRRIVLEALEHQEYPFSLLVEKLGSNRAGSHSPLVQTSFVFHSAQRSGRRRIC